MTDLVLEAWAAYVTMLGEVGSDAPEAVRQFATENEVAEYVHEVHCQQRNAGKLLVIASAKTGEYVAGVVTYERAN